ncbi:MAG: host attachment protein [Baekduia sp.]
MELTTDRLRALAETRSPEGKVLSAFINLDPHEFPTPAARATEIRAVLDDAQRRVRDRSDLTAAEREALGADIARVRDHLAGAGASEMTGGARGLAIFASQPAGLFEVLPLSAPVSPEVKIADRPAVATIARLATAKPWWVLLVDRRHARLLSGSGDGIAEHWRTEDPVAGRHDQSPSHARDQGGTSHERHQRSAEKDVADHLRGVVAELRRLLDDEPSAGLVLGGPAETTRQLRDLLPADLARTVCCEVETDVWASSPVQVLAAIKPDLARVQAERDEALLAQLADAIGTGKGAAGVAAVLDAVNERRVAKIAIAAGTSAIGVRCPACGWLGISAGGTCPSCETMTEAVDDIVEEGAARALAQGADIHVLPADADGGLLARHDGLVAGLRF